MKKADRIILQKMVQYCDRIQEIMDRFGHEQKDFMDDFAYQYAVAMCMIQIGELVTRLTSNVVLDFPSVPWKQIRAMRNIYAHDYENADNLIIWETMNDDIPDLRRQLQTIIDKVGDLDE